ncbi:polysaccharide deacetylase family protein [Candidatus Sumerlaeota bacterium]|nr:polysaccharide deacetylase family protein [Candidatus Sumerlaeota bacterium]
MFAKNIRELSGRSVCHSVALLYLLSLAISCAGILRERGMEVTIVRGGIQRGPTNKKQIALIFTGGTYAEGGEHILNVLKNHNVRASFFFTGDFLRNKAFESLIRRIVREGHYLGQHSDKHPLYCPWDDRNKTLISEEEFKRDIQNAINELHRFGVDTEKDNYWIPPYEWYNEDIARWSEEMGLVLINFTPGSYSNADYTGEADKNFRSSEFIYQKILEKEATDPNGLNGFLLLFHIGAGPGRKDKFFFRLDELMTELEHRGYSFVRIDELLNPVTKRK